MRDKDRFYCTHCERWTPVAPKSWGGNRCYTCGDEYQCGACGFEIDRAGNCLRPVVTGEWCPDDGVPAL